MKIHPFGRMLTCALALAVVALASGAEAQDACADLPRHGDLALALNDAVAIADGAGLGNDMWATLVDRDGIVCAVAFTGSDRNDQWPGSRVISAQKANTANAFSLEGFYPNVAGVGRALSTGNLYGLVLPGGSLFGLQLSNPVATDDAYQGNSRNYGQPNDPLVGSKVGGVNVFGGGLSVYDGAGQLLGALGVSGDTSCRDHIIAWRVRDALGIDNIPGGVGDGLTTDNLVLNDPPTPNSFEHPSCGFGEDPVITNLSATNPVGP